MYGFKGRLISVIALIAGILAAFVASAQDAGVVSIVPERYKWLVIALPIVSLFFTGFSERIQGGASQPEVRSAAEISDKKKGR